MEQKIVLITGCSSGIGLSLAIHLASDPSKTYKVYATMRNLDKKQRLLESVRDLHNDTMDILQMDITDQQSIGTVQRSITEGRVDILVCNAGLPFNEVYCASKFAIEGVCESLAILLQQFTIHVSLIECGPVNTDFLRNLKKTEVTDESVEVDAHTRHLYEMYLQHCEKMFQNAAQDTDDIIQVFKEVIQAQCPVFRYYTNSALLPLSSLKLTAHDGSQYIRAMSRLIFSSDENAGKLK
ncbi:hypothetical protein AMELA_G00027520 [Ameiurus melas]|uniref:Uncharacterized protein n=1 Tax=Ameiurus melas TaxID=219545 RepID=A0A7J6BD59_AMEME|nr:hypothetical protein AMELA_G00027520 [Ameiurus melas]